MILSKKERRFNILLYMLLIIATFGLLTTKLLKISIPLLIFVDSVLIIRKSREFNVSMGITLIVIMFYTILQGLFCDNTLFIIIKEVMRSVIYILVIYGVSNLYIEEKLHRRIWLYLFVFCLMIQVVQFYKFFDINKYLVRFYGADAEGAALRVSNYNSLDLFRSGSIFISINPYFKIILSVTIVILSAKILNRDFDMKDRRYTIVGIVTAVLSALFTGSRTCIAVLIVLFAEYYILSLMVKKHQSAKSFVILLLTIIVLMISCDKILALFDSMDFRAFNIIQKNGETGSLEHKVGTIARFFSESSGMRFLFGRGVYVARSAEEQMDGDLGYFFAYYGVFGFVFIVMIIRAFCKKFSNGSAVNVRGVMFTTMYVMSIITSGVYLNMRVFSTLLVIFMVNTYERRNYE